MRILVFLWMISFSAVAQQVDEFKFPGRIADMERDAHSRIGQLARASAASNNFDVKYYRCEWEVDPAIRYIKGRITVYFVATANTSSITLDLSSPLQVDSIQQRGNILSFTRPADALQITLLSSLNAGSLDSISIYYQGVPANAGFGSFEQSSHAGVPVIWTLSEPYGARDWWPCKNGLDDKVDSIDVIITAPSAYRAASNGLLQSEISIDGGTKIVAHWKHRYPIATYLMCFAVTNYTVFNDVVQLGTKSLPMVTYCYPETQNTFEAGTQNTLDALQLYNSTFGEYPFINEKYGHVQFGWGGGMEHQTSTFVVNTSESLVAHELGHQWFGDKVTCASWEHIWLNEGFATYLARFYMENKYPDDIITNRILVLNNITSVPNRAVKVDDTTSVGRIFSQRLTYNKGSYLVNMLRLKLGDAAFFTGIRNYQTDPAIRYGFAKTEDLKRNLEQASGQNLTTFFDQWFTGEGYPSYHVEWSEAGSNAVKIKINQTTSDASVPFFEMPVPLLFLNATQSKTILVDNSFNGQEYLEQIGFVPTAVIIDPNYDLISKNNTTQKIATANTGVPCVEVYPNPIQDPFTVYLHDFPTSTANVSMYNMAGQLVYRKDINLVNGIELLTIKFNNPARGQYILKINSGKFRFVKQLLK